MFYSSSGDEGGGAGHSVLAPPTGYAVAARTVPRGEELRGQARLDCVAGYQLHQFYDYGDDSLFALLEHGRQDVPRTLRARLAKAMPWRTLLHDFVIRVAHRESIKFGLSPGPPGVAFSIVDHTSISWLTTIAATYGGGKRRTVTSLAIQARGLVAVVLVRGGWEGRLN